MITARQASYLAVLLLAFYDSEGRLYGKPILVSKSKNDSDGARYLGKLYKAAL